MHSRRETLDDISVYLGIKSKRPSSGKKSSYSPSKNIFVLSFRRNKTPTNYFNIWFGSVPVIQLAFFLFFSFYLFWEKRKEEERKLEIKGLVKLPLGHFQCFGVHESIQSLHVLIMYLQSRLTCRGKELLHQLPFMVRVLKLLYYCIWNAVNQHHPECMIKLGKHMLVSLLFSYWKWIHCQHLIDVFGVY